MLDYRSVPNLPFYVVFFAFVYHLQETMIVLSRCLLKCVESRVRSTTGVVRWYHLQVGIVQSFYHAWDLASLRHFLPLQGVL